MSADGHALNRLITSVSTPKAGMPLLYGLEYRHDRSILKTAKEFGVHTALDKLRLIMAQHEFESVRVEQMSVEAQEALFHWAMRLASMGQHVVAGIDEVKYSGRLVILDDGTRWEVEEFEADTASMWGPGDTVLVADGDMWKLDDSEKVTVVEET